jgi:hypothetical protein
VDRRTPDDFIRPLASRTFKIYICNIVAKRMRRFRSYLAGLLIFSVSLLALPGAFLHDCGHIDDHAHVLTEPNGPSVDHGTCTVCDLSAPALISALQDLDFSRIEHVSAHPALVLGTPAVLWRADAPSRAPPVA